MRNLEIVRRRKCHQAFDFDVCSGGRVICAGEDNHIYLKEGNKNKLLKVKPDAGVGLGAAESIIICEDEALHGVKQIQYVSTTGHVFLATDEGAFLQCGDYSGSELTELFKSEQKIDNFAVSPDSRLVAIVTKQRTLLVLTLPDLECLVQHDNINAGALENTSCSPTSIVWRKDSRYFAVNSQVEIGDSNKEDLWEIKIYSEDGSLHSKASLEDCQLTNSTLAWQPSGGLLAGFGKTPHGNAIIFFELNGLKRSHLLISPDGNKNEVATLSWNSSSDVLAVQYENHVEIWVRSNYVWMLKSTLKSSFGSESGQVLHYEWDCELPYRIYVFFKNGDLVIYDLAFRYCTGYSDGSALTVSWNGKNIYCTPFRDNSAPPPHGFHQLKLESNVVSVLMGDFWDGFLVITEFNKIIRVCRDSYGIRVAAEFAIPKGFLVHTIDDWAWPNQSTACFAHDGKLVSFSLPKPCDTTDENVGSEKPVLKELTVTQRISLNGESIVRIQTINESFQESYQLLAVTDRNSIFLVSLENQSSVLLHKCARSFTSLSSIKLLPENTILLLFHDPLSRTLFVGSSNTPNQELLKLSSDCTSFTTFADNLLLSTLSGSLEIYNRGNLLTVIKSCDVASISTDKFTRKLEKGSVIVTCCINQMLEPSLILQVIPRGNLEIICPRPLLLSSIRVTLRETHQQDKYAKIMNALRRHRLDYRVLIDEMMSLATEFPEFTSQTSLESMIEQVQDSHSLVLLITDLDDNYADCIKVIKDLLQKSIIDDGIRKPNVEEAYLASLAKLGLLEEALRSRLIFGENKDERSLVTHRVKFLSYYCDNPDILFDTSLGTYDLTLASLVADCLGKDPKEFLPMLDELNSLTELKRKFKIDDMLRRFSKAVIHLIDDGSVQHNEILKYLERHRLFTDVLAYVETILTSQDSISSTFTSGRSKDDFEVLHLETKVSYGKYLEEHTKFKEACILYRGGKSFHNAISCAVKCGEWETALEIFYSHLTGESRTELCERILDTLEENKNYENAARLCELHLSDDRRAISYWIRNRKWRRAKCLAQKNPDLREKCVIETIKPSLLEAANERNEYLTSLNSEVCQHLDRWRVVKENKARKLLEGGFEDGDTFSDTDSISSVSSRSSGSTGTGRTSRSGKNKRKLERKLYSMKEGSAHEDLGIAAHLWNTFEKIQITLKPDTSELVTTLWEFNEHELAKEIGSTFDILLSGCTVAVTEIWATVLPDEILDMKYRIPPIGWTSHWEKLCLHDPSSKATKQ